MHSGFIIAKQQVLQVVHGDAMLDSSCSVLILARNVPWRWVLPTWRVNPFVVFLNLAAKAYRIVIFQLGFTWTRLLTVCLV
jgi:hypothetical protein